MALPPAQCGTIMKNAATIVSLAMVVFAAALAVMIGSRLTEQQIALLIGMACGVGVAIPLSVAIGMLIAGPRYRHRDAPPPIVYLAQSPLTPKAPLWPNAYSIPPRSFNVIGDNGMDDEK